MRCAMVCVSMPHLIKKSICMEESFGGCAFALAWRTEPLSIILPQQRILVPPGQ
jgi:hypothetical protein